MHILFIHQAFSTIYEAGGTRHHEMARYLATMGHQISIITSPVNYFTGKQAASDKIEFESFESGGSVSILRAYTYSALHKSFVHRVISFISFMFSSIWTGLKIKKVDIVLGTSPPIFQSVSAWVLARIKRAKFVLEIRDLWPAFAIAVGVLDNRLLIGASQWLEKFLYRHANQIMINSPGFESHIRERGGIKIDLIANGADVKMFTPDAKGESFREKYQLQNKFIALYAGAHGLSNDLEILIEAGELLKAHEDINIVLLGDGKEKSNLKKLVNDKNLNNIIFIDSIPKDEMAVALSASDVCIAILKPIEMYKTVYPNKIFDYMAAGRAIIMAIDGVAWDVVEAASAGIFTQPGNAQAITNGILTYANDQELTKSHGISGRNYVEKHFNREKLAKDMEQLFQSILNNSV
jgi:glycosyltransferase involved in cell wall biosynthesis